MAGNKTATDKLHDLLNPYFNSRVNPNWRSLVETIGEGDQDVADIVEEVRKQFFVASASRPYLDDLGVNVGVTRPEVVGMDDPTMRRYIPILSYQPKQVKLVIDDLLDLFFLREATTAFIESATNEPYLLKDTWDLTYEVDGQYEEAIQFTADDFSNITAATASEIASVINRHALNSFAVAFDDRAAGVTKVRIFSNTIGSKGSIKMTGGLANVSLKFQDVLDAGSGATTVWTITKSNGTMTFTYVSGTDPELYKVQAGDVALIDATGNTGSFVISEVNLSDGSFSFENLFGTAGTLNHGTSPNSYVRFLRPKKSIVFNRENRAVAWEVSPGEVIVEIPATPPVVRRNVKGSGHVNGIVATMTTRVSDSSLTIDDASDWPMAGQFIMEPEEEILTHIDTPLEDDDVSQLIHGRFDASERRYAYTSKSGNTLSGITPPLPEASGIFEFSLSSISRNGSNLVTATTSTPHNFVDQQAVYVYGVTGVNYNGTWIVTPTSATQFTYVSVGPAGSGTGGTARGEKVGLADSGSTLYLSTAQIGTGLLGPYMWDTKAPFVLSANVADLITNIDGGQILLNVQVSTPNTIPNTRGYLIFDYGLDTQEGPIRYLYKASEGVIAIDPSYVFQHDHVPGSGVVAIERRGPQVMSGLGKELSLYATDPGAVRGIIENLIENVKSAGIYLRFLVRYPKQFYSNFDVYASTPDPLD